MDIPKESRPSTDVQAEGCSGTIGESTILRVANLRTYFQTGKRVAKSVDDVSFTVPVGKTVAVVGESGSGKSVTSLSIMRLIAPPGRLVGGHIDYRFRDGRVIDLATATERQMRRIRGREIAMIFQEPMTSLNPLFTVGDQIGEMMSVHMSETKSGLRKRTEELLQLVEIPAAARRLDEYPHQMSGGMRQRIMIAMALACNPSLLIADEPTTALDVTIQAQILQLLRKLQAEIGMSILFITHNMGVVAEVADEIVVMYAGQVVERGPTRAVFDRQKHPYTKGLLACIPDPKRDLMPDGRRLRLNPIPGMVPSVTDLPSGCNFATRCPYVFERCATQEPELLSVGDGQESRCFRSELL